MANKKQLEADKAILTKRLAKNSTIFLTSADSDARVKAQNQSKLDLVALENINKQLAKISTTNVKPKETVKEVAKELAKKEFASNVPQISEDVIADLMVGGVDLTNKGTFAAGGIGTTALVYFGETSKPGALKFKNGKPVSSVTPTTGFKNTVITDFWKDTGLQNKIIGAYAAKGKSIGQVEAYGIWQQLVNTAAEIYQGGKGAKVTPLQLLTDTLKGVKGDEPTLPTRVISKLDKGVFNEFMDKLALSELGMALTQATKDKYYEDFNKLNTGTLTEYKKVKNKAGKLENVQITTPGLTEADMTRAASDKLKKENPKQWELNKSLSFASDLRSVMAGGI
jgi:CxxC motif-containing protein